VRAGTKSGPDAATSDPQAVGLNEFDALLAVLSDWVFVVRPPDASILRLNAAAEQRFAASLTRAQGNTSFRDLLSIADEPEITRAMDEHRAAGGAHAQRRDEARPAAQRGPLSR
jgi:hypothetical protein